MVKRNRNYKITFQFADANPVAIGPRDFDLVVVQPPFSVEIDINRNTLSSASDATIQIYNLSQHVRERLRRDTTNILVGTGIQLDSVLVQAGYGEDLPIIFNGDIFQAWSIRQGTNWVTTINAHDGGAAFVNATTSVAVQAGTPVKSIVTDLASSLRRFGVNLGAIGDFTGNIARANAYIGGTMDLMREMTGGAVFIDNQKVHVLKDSEYIDGDATVISAQSGLLGTPLRENFYINFDMLFEPKLSIGRLIKLESFTDQNFNGFYKVVSLKHAGMISGAVAGSVITSVGLFDSKPFVPVQSATG